MEQWFIENSFNLIGTFIGTGLWFAVFTYLEEGPCSPRPLIPSAKVLGCFKT